MSRRVRVDPLVQFLAIGLALFALYAFVAPEDRSGERIVVTRALVADLEATHRALWGQAPTPAELAALIQTRIDDEIVYREGVAMGLERDDAVVRRRVRQKYELIAEEEASAVPTDAELEAYLATRRDRFRDPPTLTFTQVLVRGGPSEAEAAARGAEIRQALEAGARPEEQGQATLLPLRSEAVTLDRIAVEFGAEFAEAIAALPEGAWQGPVPSVFGQHVVRVDRRDVAPEPTLAAKRAEVAREWENDRRVRAREARLKALRERYEIVFEVGP